MNRTPENIELALAELRRLLLDYDSRLCEREMRAFHGKGLADVYRAGHFTRAADKVADRVAQQRWSWKVALRESFNQSPRGGFELPPVNAFVRWLDKAGWDY